MALIESCDACVAPASACPPKTRLVLEATLVARVTPPVRATPPAARASARNCLRVFNILRHCRVTQVCLPHPVSDLRCPGRAPPRSLHMLAGKQLAGALSRAVRTLVQRACRTGVAFRRALQG